MPLILFLTSEKSFLCFDDHLVFFGSCSGRVGGGLKKHFLTFNFFLLPHHSFFSSSILKFRRLFYSFFFYLPSSFISLENPVEIPKKKVIKSGGSKGWEITGFYSPRPFPLLMAEKITLFMVPNRKKKWSSFFFFCRNKTYFFLSFHGLKTSIFFICNALIMLLNFDNRLLSVTNRKN